MRCCEHDMAETSLLCVSTWRRDFKVPRRLESEKTSYANKEANQLTQQIDIGAGVPSWIPKASILTKIGLWSDRFQE